MNYRFEINSLYSYSFIKNLKENYQIFDYKIETFKSGKIL